MCQLHAAVQEKPSPWLRGSHHPILCRSDSQVCRFWCLNNQCATLRHQHIAFHRLRITALGPSRHGIGNHPAVIHPQPTLHMYFTIGDRGHIQFIHLRTMMKEGNECPRSVKFCLQRQRWKNPQQDQNQLNGNERVPVVCVRNL